MWRYDATAGDAALRKPSLAERLPNGLIMVNDDYRNRVVVIDPTTNWIVWQYGLTDLRRHRDRDGSRSPTASTCSSRAA